MEPISVITLFCDDVFEDTSGKTTIVGILPDNVNLPSFPTSMPKLSFYTRIKMDIDADIENIEVKLSFPSIGEYITNRMDSKFIEGSRKKAKTQGTQILQIVARAVAVPFPVPTPGQLKAIVVVNSVQYLAGILNFRELPKEVTTKTLKKAVKQSSKNGALKKKRGKTTGARNRRSGR